MALSGAACGKQAPLLVLPQVLLTCSSADGLPLSHAVLISGNERMQQLLHAWMAAANGGLTSAQLWPRSASHEPVVAAGPAMAASALGSGLCGSAAQPEQALGVWRSSVEGSASERASSGCRSSHVREAGAASAAQEIAREPPVAAAQEAVRARRSTVTKAPVTSAHQRRRGAAAVKRTGSGAVARLTRAAGDAARTVGALAPPVPLWLLDTYGLGDGDEAAFAR